MQWSQQSSVTKCQYVLEKGSSLKVVVYFLTSALKTGEQGKEGKAIALFLGLNRLQTHIVNLNKMMLERNWIFGAEYLNELQTLAFSS